MNTPFIVAEISANHLGSLERALKLIDAAKKAGADAVKFQCYSAQEMVANDGCLIQGGPWRGRGLADLYQEAQTPYHWFATMFAYARSISIEPFSSIFSASDISFLEDLRCPRYKIASFELVDLPLIRKVASVGKPMILSTGMSSLDEIEEAVFHAKQGGASDITLLKCTSAYPATAADANLATMRHLAETFDRRVGLSDHTLGIAVPVAAAALGASMIEKHLTFRRVEGGPDAAFSLEPDEFGAMVKACREAAQAIGEVRYGPSEAETPQLALRRSLYFTEDLERGRMVRRDSVRTARPALGLAPKFLDQVVGSTLARYVKAGEPVTQEALE